MFNTTCLYKSVKYTICSKRKSTNHELKENSSCPAQGKATRTTQPEEGKGRVMSNAITQ